MVMSINILRNKRIYRGFLKLRLDMKQFIEDDNELAYLHITNSKFAKTYRDDINRDMTSLGQIINKDYETNFINKLKQVMDINKSNTNHNTLNAKDIKPFIKKVNLIIDYIK